jgi:hypothetical protein
MLLSLRNFKNGAGALVHTNSSNFLLKFANNAGLMRFDVAKNASQRRLSTIIFFGGFADAMTAN